MKILAFDTTNNSVSVAISEGERILAYNEELRPSIQAETIVPMIEDGLKKAKLSYNEIDYLAVTNGPGSFTGIRIGLSVAKGILLATEIKGIALSNFEFSYFRASTQIKNYEKIYIFLNAYRGQVYSQVFNQMGQATAPILLSYEQAIELLEKEQGIIGCAGSGVEQIYQKINNVENIIILPRFARVKSMHICKYLASKLLIGQTSATIIEPLYIRPPDAKLPSAPSL
jgi:tRNA threonylcarbamoyl adenosine modification protein YeaZ